LLATVAELATNALLPAYVSVWNPVYGLLLSILLVTIIASVNTIHLARRVRYFYYSAF